MTDFNADVREKKSIASGAKHRKGGSKSKKCTLPSDNLTAKEKKALNGDLHTLNFDKVYSIDELEIFSKQTQKEYLAYLAKHVCESLEEFCQFFKLTEPQMKNYMFGVNFKYTGPEKKATNSMSVREMITKAPLPEFKKIVVDGVTIPFDMTQLEARANVDTTENREIFCAMLKFVYTCRVSAYYVYRCMHISPERFYRYLYTACKTFNIDSKRIDAIRLKGYTRDNRPLKAEYNTLEERIVYLQTHSMKAINRNNFNERIELVDEVCNDIIRPPVETVSAPVAETPKDLVVPAVVTDTINMNGKLHLEGKLSDVIEKLTCTLNSNTTVVVDVEF